MRSAAKQAPGQSAELLGALAAVPAEPQARAEKKET